MHRERSPSVLNVVGINRIVCWIDDALPGENSEAASPDPWAMSGEPYGRKADAVADSFCSCFLAGVSVDTNGSLSTGDWSLRYGTA